MKRRLILVALVALAALALACQKSPAPTGTNEPAAPAAKAPTAPIPPIPPTVTAVADKKAGSRVTGQGFVLEVQPPPAAPVGTPAIAQIVLRPTDGYHVNNDGFPTSLELKASDSVALDKASQSPSDAAKFGEDGAAFEVKFTPNAEGNAEFTAVFKFAMCTETTCNPQRETLAWNVAIKK